MARHELSRTQRFLTGMVNAETAAAMEAHSRAWLVKCAQCGFARSVWEMGGIRYKASETEREWGCCPRCGKTGWHHLVKADNFPTTHVPSGSLVRLIVLLTLGMMVVIGGVVLLILWLTGVFG